MTRDASDVAVPLERDLERAGPPLLPFAGLYIAFGATFGLIGSAAPLVLRARGTGLPELGLLQLIYLPMTVSFLWAPIVDRIRLPFLSHRIAYIATAQVATAGLLVAVASIADRFPGVSLGGLFALAFGVSAAAATMDIALEALVVDTVATRRRSPVTTVKLCGSALGGMLGISLATTRPATIGLNGAFDLVAVLNLAVIAPILFYDEPARQVAVARRPRAVLRPALGRAVALGLYFAASLLIGENPGLVLLDLHVPLATAGLMTGVVIPAVSLVMTFVSGALASRIVAHRLITVLATGAAASALLLSMAAFLASPSLAVAAAALIAAFLSLLGVPVFNLVYRWAEGGSAATSYAILFGVASLLAMPARVGAPVLVSRVGWSLYFAMTVPLYAAAVGGLIYAMRHPASNVAS